MHDGTQGPVVVAVDQVTLILVIKVDQVLLLLDMNYLGNNAGAKATGGANLT